MNNRHAEIEQAIAQALDPEHLEIVDESHMHSVPEGAQSHFRVTVVSNRFEGEKLLARHRRINGLLSDQFEKGLHALALHTLTPAEWFEKGGVTPTSPPCLGGSKSSGR